MTEAEARAHVAQHHTNGQRLLTEIEKMLRLASAVSGAGDGDTIRIDRAVVRAKLRELDAYLTLVGRTPDA